MKFMKKSFIMLAGIACLIATHEVTAFYRISSRGYSMFTKARRFLSHKKAFTAIGVGLTAYATLPVVSGAEQYPELAKFIKKYRCSADVENNQEKHHLKGNEIERIINAERMKKCFEINNLDLLRVADKCLCQTKDGDLEVLSVDINPKKYKQSDEKLTLSEVQQLVTFAENTGFRDWVHNFDWDINNKLTFYDTEDNSFVIGRIRGVEGVELPDHCKFNFVASLGIYSHHMEPDAKEWFYDRLETLLNSPEGTTAVNILPHDQKYDDGEIDFEQVKKEFNKSYRNLKATRTSK